MSINTDAVQRLYIAYFNRPSDPAGQAYWEGQLSTTTAATQAQLTSLAAGFSGSAEYTALYAGQTNTQIINNLYLNLFGRAAEPAALVGTNSWVYALDNNTQSFASIALQLTYSAQGTDATAIANKLIAATDFTNAIDTTAEITGYSGTGAAESARTWLATVTDDAATLAAATTTAAIDAATTAAVAAGDTVAGSVFVLTTDSFNWDGTTGNDTFNVAKGIIDGQTIDGGAGTDIMNLSVDSANDNGAAFSMTNVETLNIRVSGATGTVVALDFTDVTGVDLLNARALSDNLTLNGLTDLNATYQASNISTDAITMELNFLNSAVSGTADTINLAVDSVTATGTDFIFTIDDGIEAISLDVAGTGNVLEITGTGTLAATSLDITGTGDIALSFTGASIVNVDASAYTGDLSIALSATAALSVLGGSGDDYLDVSSLTTASTSNTSIIDGGAGNDTIVIDASVFNLDGVTISGGAGTDTLAVTLATASHAIGTTTATVAAISGIDTLSIDASAVGTGTGVDVALDLAALGLATAVNTVELTLASDADFTFNISNMVDENLVLNMTGSAGATDLVTVSAALATTTGTTDAISIDIANSLTAGTASMNLILQGYETISLDLSNASTSVATESNSISVTDTALTSANIVIESGVMAFIGFDSATALASVVLSGAGNIELSTGSVGSVGDLGVNIDASALTGNLTASVAGTATDDRVSITAGAGDDDITIGQGRYTVDLGAGADSLYVDTNLTNRDSLDGGAGIDTLTVNFTNTSATNINITAVNFEVLGFDLDGGTTTTITADVSAVTALTAITVYSDDDGDDLTIQGVSNTSIDVTFQANDANADLSISNSSTGTADVMNLTITSNNAGVLTLDGWEVINVSLTTTNTTGTTSMNIEEISAASATSLVITATTAVNLATSGVMTIDLADGATIDLTGINGDIGTTTASGSGGGILVNGSESYTIQLGDDSASAVRVIDLGTATGTGTDNVGVDVIEFISIGNTDDIGDVYISNFNDRTNYSIADATVIDLSGLGVTSYSELSISGASTATITSTGTAFVGVIHLVGISAADLTAANFVFA